MTTSDIALGLFLLTPVFLQGQGLSSVPGTPGAMKDSVSMPGERAESNGALSLAQALSLAGENSPLLKIGVAQIEGANAAITTAKTRLNPEVNLLDGHQHIRLPTSVPGLLQHYGVAQRIELPSLRRARIRASTIGRESSELGLAERHLDLRSAVKQSFYAAIRRRREAELARQDLQLVQDFRRRIDVQVTTGEAARLELTRADAELARVRTTVRSAELQFLTALAALRANIGAPPEKSLDPRAELSSAKILPSLDELRKQALALHPAIAQSESEIRRSEALLQAEKAARLPQPTLLAEYEQQPDLRFYRLGFSFPIPLVDQRKGPIGEATARLHESHALLKARQLEITSSLETAYGEFEVADQQVAALQNGALREAEAALAAAEAAYKFGERGIIEVLDAQRVLHGVRLDFLNAQFDREAALIELERLRAVDLP